MKYQTLRLKLLNKLQNKHIVLVEGKSRKIESSFMTDNWKTRKVRKQKEIKIGKKSYGKCVRNVDEKGIDFCMIYANLIEDEKSNSSQVEISPPVLCTNSAYVANHFCSFVKERCFIVGAE